MPHLDYGFSLHVRSLDFNSLPSLSSWQEGFPLILSYLSGSLTFLPVSGCLLSCGAPLPGCHASYGRPCSALLFSVFPLECPAFHLRGTAFLSPYFFLLSSIFLLTSPSPFSFAQKILHQFQARWLPNVSPASPPSPSLTILGVCSWWLWLLSFITGFIWVLLPMASSSRYLISLWCSDIHGQKVRQTAWDMAIPSLFSSFISERERHKKTAVTTCVVILFCELLSQKMLDFKGIQPVQRKTVEYGNVFIHLVSHPCSFEFQIMKPIALVLFSE